MNKKDDSVDHTVNPADTAEEVADMVVEAAEEAAATSEEDTENAFFFIFSFFSIPLFR